MKSKVITLTGMMLIGIGSMAASPPILSIYAEPALCIPGVLDCYSNSYSSRVFILATNGVSAPVILDASRSFDPGGNDLTAYWSEYVGEEEGSGFFAAGLRVTNEFAIGYYDINVSVYDDFPFPSFRARYTVYLNVYPPAEAAESVREVLHDEAPRTRFNLFLQRILQTAIDRLDSGDTAGGVRFLSHFRRHLESRPLGLDSFKVAAMAEVTDILIESLSITEP